TEARKALSAVYRTGQKFGTAHVIDVLRGNMTDKVTQFGHDTLPTFGSGAERSKREWQGILRQMVAAGLLDLDVTGFGGLRATDAGISLMHGEGDGFQYRPDTVKKGGRSKSRSGSAVQDTERLDADGALLLQNLKALRLELATARGVPAYVIFSDRSLIDMATRRPHDLTSFGDVFGVGKAKIRDFGEIFLGAIAAFESATAPTAVQDSDGSPQP
ncbi:MAG: RQC domain-containing protein, partial [Pseudomonadota bacterium]